MTAVVGILNKQGIAIAADSAVTVSGVNNRKIYNSANKIFTLSKYNPVGIAIFNNAQFLGVPWEILIKEYRRKLDKQSFPYLQDYTNDFLEWLRENNYFTNEKDSKSFIFNDFVAFIQFIVNEIAKTNRNLRENFQDILIPFLKDFTNNKIKKFKVIESLKNLKSETFHDIINKMVPDALKILKNNLNVRFDDKVVGDEISLAYFNYIKHNYFFNYSGLIFTGFGENELFPQLIPLNVSFVIDNKLRFEIDEAKIASITNQINSCIRPFAQTDVIDTILQGISPELNHLSVDVFGNFIHAFLKEITQIKDMPEQAIKRLEALNINNYITQYQKNFGNIIRHKYVNPLMGAVAQLSKEDLAEMAESLVYLTYLKRRFTLAEESVGGPVDIAVITKGDGFVWIKRKHYFDPQLNQSFFQRYL